MLLPVTCSPSDAALRALLEICMVPNRLMAASRREGRSRLQRSPHAPREDLISRGEMTGWQARCLPHLRLLVHERSAGVHRLPISICRLHSAAGGDNLQKLRNM